jgi:hypothetical protein
MMISRNGQPGTNKGHWWSPFWPACRRGHVAAPLAGPASLPAQGLLSGLGPPSPVQVMAISRLASRKHARCFTGGTLVARRHRHGVDAMDHRRVGPALSYNTHCGCRPSAFCVAGPAVYMTKAYSMFTRWLPKPQCTDKKPEIIAAP